MLEMSDYIDQYLDQLEDDYMGVCPPEDLPLDDDTPEWKDELHFDDNFIQYCYDRYETYRKKNEKGYGKGLETL